MAIEILFEKPSNKPKNVTEPVLISAEWRNNGEGWGAPQDLICVYKLPDGSKIEVVKSSWDDLYIKP